MSSQNPPPAAADLITAFTPKFITVLREGYTLQRFGADAIAGLTVAIVALPLAMGIGIASGSTPDRALFTAIVAGFLISLLGGSRYQIGGPTAAFIVVVYRIIERQGYDGLALATMMAGAMLVVMGVLRLGTYIKYIPFPVTIGFTAGIGVTIFASQVADLLGLTTGKLPGDFVPKVEVLATALPTISVTTTVLALASGVFILVLRRHRPTWPGLLLAVIGASVVTLLLHLNVETIQSKFGAIPSSLPYPALPSFSWAKITAVFPDAVTIAVLAGIESLLSAVIADGMTGSRHRSNCELVAQGIANLASPLFGGLPATGAIARTATNVRSGSTGPVSGILHAVFLLAFMFVAAPLMGYVPLAVLAAILTIVAWNMSEIHVVLGLLQNSGWGDRLVLVSTMLLTVFYDLTVGIEVGVVLSAILFMHNMAGAVGVEHGPSVQDNADDAESFRKTAALPEGTIVFRINGPFFFGAASDLAANLGRIGPRPTLLVLDFAQVPLIDATGASVLKGVIGRAGKQGASVILSAVSPAVRRDLVRLGIKAPAFNVLTSASIDTALAGQTSDTL